MIKAAELTAQLHGLARCLTLCSPQVKARITASSHAAFHVAFLLLLLARPIYAQSYSSSAVYQNPDSVMPGVTKQSWAQQPCRDPWINIAYSWALGTRPRGQGDQGECWTGQYASGRWRDYNALVHAVARYKRCMNSIQQAYSIGSDGRWKVIDKYNRVVGNDSASMNAQLIAQGGGNLVATGGGNLIGSNGGMRYRVQGVEMLSCAN